MEDPRLGKVLRRFRRIVVDAFPEDSLPVKTMNQVERVMSEGAEYRRRLETQQGFELIRPPRQPMDWRYVARMVLWAAVFAFSIWFVIYLASHGYPAPVG